MSALPQPTSPPGRIFLTAEWRYLAMLNYAVDPALLLPHVPRGTELDLFDGKAYASVVAFRFLATKVLGVAIPFHRNFTEVNLRFYVRRMENGVPKRGVVFLHELVPRFAIAAVARLAYHENYRAVPMAHRIERADAATRSKVSLEYSWRLKPYRYRLQVRAAGEAYEAAPGSLEQFITEHYWGYCAQRNNGCLEYRVAHPPWRLWPVREARYEGDFSALYGREFARQFSRPPDSVFLAEGSKVEVYAGRKLES